MRTHGVAIIFIIAILVWAFVLADGRVGVEIVEIKIGEQTILAEVVSSRNERTRGLSGRADLAADAGMLFVFKDPDHYGTWMKDMNFSIDIIWLDENKEVVHIAAEIPPESFPNSFKPDQLSKYVLELPAGAADFYKIEEGTEISFDLK